ncbi:MAG TPA: hypothetical protein PKE16_14295 [Hyphomicrobium sp.]|nr:hypothetical protein [Hyphomicrobium sp.]
MVVPLVDAHVCRCRHMTGRASGGRRIDLMMVMLGRIKSSRGMALRAHAVSLKSKLTRMRVMAIGTSYAGSEHPALDERSVRIDFFVLLPV